MLVIFLAGGASQLETWDPKPGTDTGGPFRAIPTTVPGTHICELLPFTAKQTHRLAIVRGVNTAMDDHGIGEKIMLTGRKPEAGIEYPQLGAVAAKLLGSDAAGLPAHISDPPQRRQRLRQERRRVPRPEVRFGVARRRQAARGSAPSRVA